MGLDMYLSAKRFVWYNEDDLSEAIAKAFPDLKEQVVKIKEVTAEGCYWRKANQIHQWFVINVQDGEDECREYEVSREELKTLVEVCKEVLNDRSLAETKLPPHSGFFFGSTDIDEYYFEDLSYTVKSIEETLEKFDEKWYFTYQSSW